jgi:hypothetical protein
MKSTKNRTFSHRPDSLCTSQAAASMPACKSWSDFKSDQAELFKIGHRFLEPLRLGRAALD